LDILIKLTNKFMVTIVNTPNGSGEGSGAGVAAIVIVVVLIILFALFVWPGFVKGGAGAPAAPGANINVTLPTGGGEGGGAAQ
jgi:hypothetical protein